MCVGTLLGIELTAPALVISVTEKWQDRLCHQPLPACIHAAYLLAHGVHLPVVQLIRGTDSAIQLNSAQGHSSPQFESQAHQLNTTVIVVPMLNVLHSQICIALTLMVENWLRLCT